MALQAETLALFTGNPQPSQRQMWHSIFSSDSIFCRFHPSPFVISETPEQLDQVNVVRLDERSALPSWKLFPQGHIEGSACGVEAPLPVCRDFCDTVSQLLVAVAPFENSTSCSHALTRHFDLNGCSFLSQLHARALLLLASKRARAS